MIDLVVGGSVSVMGECYDNCYTLTSLEGELHFLSSDPPYDKGTLAGASMSGNAVDVMLMVPHGYLAECDNVDESICRSTDGCADSSRGSGTCEPICCSDGADSTLESEK